MKAILVLLFVLFSANGVEQDLDNVNALRREMFRRGIGCDLSLPHMDCLKEAKRAALAQQSADKRSPEKKAFEEPLAIT